MCRRGIRVRTFRRFLLMALLLGMAFQALGAQERRGLGRGVSDPPLQSFATFGYAADGLNPVSGGLSQDPVTLGTLDLLLHLNLDAIPMMGRSQLRLHLQNSHGGSVSSRVGDFQGVSNLEAGSEWRLHEAWIERQVFHPGLSILVGVYDVNSEFDVMPAAAGFLNSAFGFGSEYSACSPCGPSTFPETGLAARARAQLHPSFYALLGASDGAPGGTLEEQFSLSSRDGALLSFEVGYTKRGANSAFSPEESTRLLGRGWGRGRGPFGYGRQRKRPGRGRIQEEVDAKLALGGWTHTRRAQKLSSGESRGPSWGLYALGEHILSRRADGSGSLRAFARAGMASGEVNRVGLFLGGGLAWEGLLADRPQDAVGLGLAHARNGSSFLRAQEAAGVLMDRGETVLELHYRFQAGEHMAIQPDLQWVRNPGMNPEVSDALLLGVRGHLLLNLPFGNPGS